MFLTPEQDRADDPPPAVHERGPERDVVIRRVVVQEQVAEAIREYPVGWQLVADHGPRPGEVAIRRDP